MNSTRDKFIMLALTAVIATLSVVAVNAVYAPIKHSQPHGLITGKYWNSAFWKDGVQVEPAMYCLEIDYRMSTCVEESIYNKYDQGVMYP